MKKKILIYAHYYAPDKASTGQILQDMAEGMKDDFDVTVICTVPSYTGVIEDKYKEKKIYEEELNGVKIYRVPVPEFSKSNKKSRIKNLLAYYSQAKKVTGKVGPQDYIFTISQPPIMGGMLGVYGKKKIRTEKGEHPKFIYCIQDYNPEQIEATGYVKMKPVMNRKPLHPDSAGRPRLLPHVQAVTARARVLPRKGARHSGEDLLQVRGQQHIRLAQAQQRHRPGLLRQGAGPYRHYDRDRRGPVGHGPFDGQRFLRPQVPRLHGKVLLRAEALPPRSDEDIRR